MNWSSLVPELLVADVNRSVTFYGLLGFSVRFERGAPRFAYLELGDAQLMLEEDHDGAWRTGAVEAPRGRGVNVSIEVADVEEVENGLRAAGVPLYGEVVERWYDIGGGVESGQRELLVQDPDGYLLRPVQQLGERPR